MIAWLAICNIAGGDQLQTCLSVIEEFPRSVTSLIVYILYLTIFFFFKNVFSLFDLKNNMKYFFCNSDIVSNFPYRRNHFVALVPSSAIAGVSITLKWKQAILKVCPHITSFCIHYTSLRIKLDEANTNQRVMQFLIGKAKKLLTKGQLRRELFW